MKYASDFRKIARDSLTGRWGIAVLTGLVASLLGGSGSSTFNFNLSFTGSSSSESSASFSDLSTAVQDIPSTVTGFLIGFVGIILLVALAFAVAFSY